MGLEVIKENYEDLPIIYDKYPNVNFHSRTKDDRLNPHLLDDIQTAAKKAGIVVTVNWAKTNHRKYTESGAISRHWKGLAVDVSSIEGSGWTSKNNAKKIGNYQAIEDFVKQLKNLGYSINLGEGPKIPKAVLYFGFPGHEDHVHVSNTSLDGSSDYNEVDDDEDIENIDDDISMEELVNLKDYLIKKGKQIGKEKINKLVDGLKKLQSMKVGDISGKIKDVIVTAAKSISELE
jgi:hypothetical protein